MKRSKKIAASTFAAGDLVTVEENFPAIIIEVCDPPVFRVSYLDGEHQMQMPEIVMASKLKKA